MARNINKRDLLDLMGNVERCIEFLFEERPLNTKKLCSKRL